MLRVVHEHGGQIGSTKGDGLVGLFGHPIAHDDDVGRAVKAGLEITREVSRLSDQAQRRFGFRVNVRVGVHWGLVYLDTAQGDVYGSAANLANRISGSHRPAQLLSQMRSRRRFGTTSNWKPAHQRRSRM